MIFGVALYYEKGKVSHLVAICLEYHGITRSMSCRPMNGFTMPTLSVQRAIDVLSNGRTTSESWACCTLTVFLGPKSSND